MAQVKRETAVICIIDSLLKGSFVKTEGWNPSYFSTDFGDVSRVNIMGVVVSNEAAGGLLVDDGSGRILLRSFEGNVWESVSLGDLIIIIGRPRVYNDQKYILPEIVKKIDPRWGEYRKIQLELLRKNTAPVRKEKRVILSDNNGRGTNYFQKILEFAKDLDDGNGAEAEEVIKRSGAPNGDELVKKLIEEGEIFEIRPGKIKILE